MSEINGTDADDALDGTGGADVIIGFDGSDTLSGGDGNDVLYGGSGGPADPIERLSVNSSGREANEDSWAVAVSPNGETVLFWSDATNLTGYIASRSLFSLDRSTGEITRLTTNVSTSSPIAFSPDGSMIAYQVSIPNSLNHAAWVMNLETGQRYAVSKNEDGFVSRVLTDPVFSTDGQSILAVTTRKEADWGDVGLYLVEWNLAGAIVGYVRLDTPSNNAFGVEIAFSADQQQLVLRYEASGDHLAVLDRTTGAMISEIDAAAANDGLRSGVLSADGGTVAWVGSDGLHVYDVATETDRLLLADAASMRVDLARFVLGDGALVVQVTYDLPGQDNFEARLLLVDIVTGDAIELAVGGGPIVSADGTSITFSSSDPTLVPGDTNGDTDIFQMTLPDIGEPSDTLNGGAGNDTLDGGWGADVMTGGVGNDSYYVDNSGDVVTELAGGGIDTVYSSISYTVADDANIEVVQLIGRLALNATGSSGDDTLIGNEGANVLEGGAGVDDLRGGLGNDTFVIRDAQDQIVEITGQGTDTVQSWISFAFDQGQSVEHLTLMGTADLNARGNTKANTIRGNSGDNTLDGWTGSDKLYGGAGDDTYITDAGDQVFELAGEGTDTVRSANGFTLGANIENLILLGSAQYGTGNDQANVITGNAAANILDGKGGADTLRGGKGNDTYRVDDLGDVIVEAKGDAEGVDLVYASISFALKSGSYVENLTLTGTALDGTGNGIANVITGTANANVLDGRGGDDTLDGGLGDDTLIGGDGNDILKGGQGVDDMTGGDGNDTYHVDDIRDAITEAKGDGTDIVLASVNFTLQPGVYVDNLTLTGSANINGTGNGIDNVIRGNSGANSLNGGGGSDTLYGGGGNDALNGGASGADKMYGGAGNDTYFVNSSGDKAYEVNGEGTDTVNSSASYSLTGQYIENLTLTGSSGIYAKGNTLDNTLIGNSGANKINGMAGKDTLTGGAGADTFIWDATSHSKVSNSDRIVDLTNEDFIDLSRIDANTTTAGTQHFVLVDAFTSTAGQVMLKYDSASGVTSLTADTNGDGVADMLVRIDGNHENFDNFIFGG